MCNNSVYRHGKAGIVATMYGNKNSRRFVPETRFTIDTRMFRVCHPMLLGVPGRLKRVRGACGTAPRTPRDVCMLITGGISTFYSLPQLY